MRRTPSLPLALALALAAGAAAPAAAADPAGNVYVCEQDNARVQVFESVSTPAVRTSWGAVKRPFR